MRVPWRRRRNLAERLRPYVHHRALSESLVALDRIRMFLFRWMIETGDSIEVVAKGFDVDAALLRRIASGEMDAANPTLVRRLASQMGVEECLLGDFERRSA